MDHSLPGSSVLGAYPGKNTGVSCHALLQGIFPTQGLNIFINMILWINQKMGQKQIRNLGINSGKTKMMKQPTTLKSGIH